MRGIAQASKRTTAFASLLTATLTLAAAPTVTEAAGLSSPVFVGDRVNGRGLYMTACASCHGETGDGGASKIALTRSGRMGLLSDAAMFAMISTGEGLKKPAEHRFGDRLEYLETFDVIAYVRAGTMSVGEFFPEAARYLGKEYTIDEFGLTRIKEATGKALSPEEAQASVFTMFRIEGEDGNLRYVPQDPIQLDALKKDLKIGYLVFLPFRVGPFSGEIGVAMDAAGVITGLRAQDGHAQDAVELNKKLAQFVGMGKKGQRDRFKAPARTSVEVSNAVFQSYMQAMESATMYDREEKDRTWAD
ncbi:MAG: hypothetical protein IPK13_00790 [Deltaproteobacteria bacterium]|nr:hypothetical protein [Deltaproteobacteria bacterium]